MKQGFDLREAGENDKAALEAYLEPRRKTSMFLSSNLLAHGVTGKGHPRATRFWIIEENQQIVAVIGLSEMGFLLVEASRFDPEWSGAIRRAMAGSQPIAASGEKDQVEGLINALNIPPESIAFRDDEPLYALSLTDLIIPAGTSTIRNMRSDDLTLVTDWRDRFEREIFPNEELSAVRSQPEARARDMIAQGTGRLLLDRGQVVAMTAFNATLPEIVQIGSVYTPPENRGCGHARRAVALHLAEAMREGVKEAVLFSSGAAASKAYEAIGFRHIGTYTMMDFRTGVVIE